MSIGISKVTTKGQVTIPEDIRRDKGINTGTRLIFFEVEEGILLKKSEDVRDMFKVFQKRVKETGLTRKKLAADVEEEKTKTLEKYFR